MDVSFSCVYLVINNEFRHNIVKVVCGFTATFECYDEIHDQQQNRRMKN